VSFEHPECFFKGGECCRYVLKWAKPASNNLSSLRNLTLIGLGSAWGLHLVSPEILGTSMLYPASLVALLGAYVLEIKERRKVEERLAQIQDPTEQLIEQTNANYNNALVTMDIGQAIRQETNSSVILSSVLGVLNRRLGYSFGVVLLFDEARESLTYGDSYGFAPENLEYLPVAAELLSQAREGSKIWESFVTQRSLAVENLSQNRPSHPAVAEVNATLAVNSFACSPIVCDQVSMGVVFVGYFYSDTKASIRESDLSLLAGIAPVLAVALRNAKLRREQEVQLGEILALEESRAIIARERDRAERLAEDLQQTNEEIKSFAHIVSHDLRAPLVNIRGFAVELQASIQEASELLVPELPGMDESKRGALEMILNKDVPDATRIIGSSVQRMDGQINAILKLSRLGRRELIAERVDLKALVEGMLQTLSHQLETRQATAQVADLPVLHCDRFVMEQIFGNLLDNATKYLDPTRPGSVRIEAERLGGELLIHVHDNGRGIASEDMEKVFAPFRRAGKIDTQGEGMGLAYVRTLVRALGGRIHCHSTFGVGTTFTVSIPAQRP